jgi:hypothetical protein
LARNSAPNARDEKGGDETVVVVVVVTGMVFTSVAWMIADWRD